MGRIENKPVFVTKIFIDNGKNERLLHGVEIFEDIYGKAEMEKIQKDRSDQRNFYTLEHIMEALEVRCGQSFSHIQDAFYKMVLVDAWLGNQDRHAENWGVIAKEGDREDKVEFRFAPLFDTARGLLWNETLFDLYSKYSGNRKQENLAKYIEKSTPLMSLDGQKNISHFALSQFVRQKAPKVFFHFREKLARINIVEEIYKFDRMLHRVRIQLIVKILEKRRKTLMDI